MSPERSPSHPETDRSASFDRSRAAVGSGHLGSRCTHRSVERITQLLRPLLCARPDMVPFALGHVPFVVLVMAVVSLAGFPHAYVTPKEKVVFAPTGVGTRSPVRS